jgi:hypothetical protein
MMHMNGGTLEGVKIISSESSALMQSEITTTNYEGERYGMALLRTNDMLEGHRLLVTMALHLEPIPQCFGTRRRSSVLWL